MRRGRGQALVELALCVPVVVVLGLGAVGVVQVLEAESGLQAATAAALAAAARSPDATTAQALAHTTFVSIAAGYPLRSAAITLAVGAFGRGSVLTADTSAMLDLTGESITFLPARIALHAHASLRIESWRSRP